MQNESINDDLESRSHSRCFKRACPDDAIQEAAFTSRCDRKVMSHELTYFILSVLIAMNELKVAVTNSEVLNGPG